MRLLRTQKPKLFNHDWFVLYQFLLQIGINSPIKGLREDIRNRLDLSVDRNVFISRLLPNSFAIRTGEREFQETFYSRNFFADSVYRELLWLWNIIHKWDMNFANHFVPRLNLGFDTLTAYPDANPEVNTCDGIAMRNAPTPYEIFSTIRNGVGNAIDDSAQYLDVKLWASITSAKYYTLQRGHLFFMTNIGNDAIISTATFGGSRYAAFNGLGQPDLHIADSTSSSTTGLVNGDYSQIGRTSYGSLAYSEFATNGYKYITLNSNGIANINKTGISRFSLQLSWDINNSTTGLIWASEAYSYIGIWAAEKGVSYAPKLEVTYILPRIFPMNLQNIMTQIRM